jgi:cellulose synthase/poly-beta-1,6-N-acetylglucosamine synthase-like glycosyltransferase
MLQHALWIISFFSLWLVIIWLQIMYWEEPEKRQKKELPSITIGVAAYNEENTITKTLNSLVKADYPREKIEIIVVNDGSRDSTADVVNSFISKHRDFNIKLISKKNRGKASAVNVALEKAENELFGVVDADSRIEPDSLKIIAPHFSAERIGAVISRVRVDKPKKMLERVQRFEYIMSNMIRNLMAKIGTLAMTPGVLSVYRTELIRELGYFDENKKNLTEDLEIAMRLKYNGYRVEMEPKSTTHTMVPPTIRKLWRQRIRWARGYVYNHWKYKSMFFSRKHGIFGIFQMPVNVLVVILLILNIGIISYSLFNDTIEFAIRSLTIEGYFVNNFLSIPSIKEIFLGQNLRIAIPIMIAFALGIYLIILTHKVFKEKLAKQIVPVVAYFLFVPYFMTVNWISSIAQEMLRTKKKW